MIRKVWFLWFICMLFFICGDTFAGQTETTSPTFAKKSEDQSVETTTETPIKPSDSEPSEKQDKERPDMHSSVEIKIKQETEQKPLVTQPITKEEKAKHKETHTEISEEIQKHHENNLNRGFWCDLIKELSSKASKHSDLIQVFLAIAVFLVSIIALFQKGINKFIYGPKLKIDVISADKEGFITYDENAIYCHLKCINSKFLWLFNRSSTKNVKVVLTDVLNEKEESIFSPTNEPIPLLRQYERVYDNYYKSFPTVIKHCIFDLARITKEVKNINDEKNEKKFNEYHRLELQTHPEVKFDGKLAFGLDGKGKLFVKVRGKSDDTFTKEVKISIDWITGEWPKDNSDIANHFKFTKM